MLQNRIALITGASRGIGAAVAKRFAKEGAHVILVARTVDALQAIHNEIVIAGGTATSIPLDLNDHNKIDELGAVVAQRFSKLDILVGNAAVLGDLTPLAQADAVMWNNVISVNVTANWRLIRALDPMLKLSDAGRAIFVSSGVTKRKQPKAFWGPYAVSKAALEVLVGTYAAEIADTNIRVNLIDPGVVRTAMRAGAVPSEDPLTLPTPESITDIFVQLSLPNFLKNNEIFDV